MKAKSIKDEFALRLVKRAGDVSDIETLMSDDLNIVRSSPEHHFIKSSFSNDRNRRIIATRDLGPAGDVALQFAQLHQSDGSLYVGHVVLVAGRDDLIVPRPVSAVSFVRVWDESF